MNTDKETLNFVAAVLCGIGSFAAFVAAVGERGDGPRAAVLSGLAGTIGSAAWALAAYQDMQNRGPELT